MKTSGHGRTAIWALTPNGGRLARTIAEGMAGSTLFLSEKLAVSINGAVRFNRLKGEINRQFANFSGHVFIMATGIVVRSIADHLAHKTTDPAVVVCDEAGRFAISLVSGHIGGANALAREVARLTGGQPVITTATDVNRVPAIDIIAVEAELSIENPDAIKAVNMALLTGSPIVVHDPYAKVIRRLPEGQTVSSAAASFDRSDAGVFVDHMRLDLPPHVLVLRPGSLVAGMGCNRGTDGEEMRDLLVDTFAKNRLAISSLRAIATVDLKADERGLLELAESLNVPLTIFTRDRLKARCSRCLPRPAMVEKTYRSQKRMREAAALLATNRGQLIVPKQKTANVTLAVAADSCTSSASDPAGRNT